MGNSVSNLALCHKAGVEVIRAKDRLHPMSKMGITGEFCVEHWRDGKLLSKQNFPNGITTQGKNKLFDVGFHNQTQLTVWYLGLVDLASFTALAAGDTYGSHSGWIEFASYTDGNNSDNATTRPAWPEDAASGGSISNTTVAIFNITGSGTVKGVFLCGGTNAQTKSNSTSSGNFLWATALFGSGDQAVTNGDQLKVTYTITA